MKIQIGHSRDFDFEDELYQPLRTSALNDDHQIVLPHEIHDAGIESYASLKDVDLFVAEVSHASTGLGMELAWAQEHGVPILCIHREDAQPTGSLRYIDCDTINYSDGDDMIEKITSHIAS